MEHILILSKVRNGNSSNTQSALLMIISFTFVNLISFVFSLDNHDYFFRTITETKTRKTALFYYLLYIRQQLVPVKIHRPGVIKKHVAFRV